MTAAVAADAGRQPVILNLPATVEVVARPMSTPTRSSRCTATSRQRESVIALACTRTTTAAPVCAAARARPSWPARDRVEGSLFGNGERTGQRRPRDARLSTCTPRASTRWSTSPTSTRISDVPSSTANQLRMPPRHPYRRRPRLHRVLAARTRTRSARARERALGEGAAGSCRVDVPYLPIDPADIGRAYDAIIRVNSQSRQGRHRLLPRARLRARRCRAACRSIQPGDPAHRGCDRQGTFVGRDPRGVRPRVRRRAADRVPRPPRAAQRDLTDAWSTWSHNS